MPTRGGTTLEVVFSAPPSPSSSSSDDSLASCMKAHSMRQKRPNRKGISWGPVAEFVVETEYSTPERSSFLPLPPRLRPQKGVAVKENILTVEPNTVCTALPSKLTGQKRKWGSQHRVEGGPTQPPTPPQRKGKAPAPIAMGWVREVAPATSPSTSAAPAAPPAALAQKPPRKRSQPTHVVANRSRICLACDFGRKRKCTCGKRTRRW